MIFIGIVVAILMFSIIVILHEFGHFSAARIFWVRVEEFGLGIPPRAKKLFTDKKWTLFSLNWLPLWGFVKLTWETPHTFNVYNANGKLYNNENLEIDIQSGKPIFDKENNEIPDYYKNEILLKLKENSADYNLANKSAWKQAIIILAGVFMNFLLAGIIFSILFFVWVKPVGVNDKIQTNYDLKLIPTYEQSLEIWLLQKNWWIILQPVKDSISEKSGFKIWDNIIKVNGNLITSAEEFIDIISKNPDKELEITYNPYCKTCENSYWDEKYLLLTPSPEGKIWAYISENISLNTNFQYQYWFTDSVKYGFSETYYQTLLTFRWIWILIKKIFNPETPQERQEAIEQVSGPIGIVDFISNSLSEWAKFILIIWAIISINLWVFNLLPIPALDGWRFIFITINGWIQKLFGKKAISQQVENYIHVWFFIFLIALSILIAYNDISKIINQ